jgi:hypothetical protein
MLANIALALELGYTASEEEIVAKIHSLQREIGALRIHHNAQHRLADRTGLESYNLEELHSEVCSRRYVSVESPAAEA